MGWIGFWRRWKREENRFLKEGTRKIEGEVARDNFIQNIINDFKPTTTVTEEECSSSTTSKSKLQIWGWDKNGKK